MEHLRKHILIISILILTLSSACLFLPGSSKEKSDTLNKNSSVSEQSETEEIQYDEGGFSFMPISDWKVDCAIGIIQMRAPGADPDYGPGFMIMAGDNEIEMTTEEAFEKFKSSSTGKVSKPKKVKVGGYPGLMAELITSQNGKEVKAYVVTSMLTDTRQFTMIAVAPESEWDENIKPQFEDVLESIKFIDIIPDAGCPVGISSNESEVSIPSIPEEPEAEIPDSTEVPGFDQSSNDGQLHQWAAEAKASSEYSSPNWSAIQATGEPNVENCEDSSDAWASEDANTKEWIELTYDVPVYPTEINIHMNYNPSQVVEVQIITTEGKAYTVTETKPEIVPYCPDVYSISLDLTKQVLVDRVKIFLDQSKLGIGWNEIDAVELIGTPDGIVSIPATPQEGAPSSPNDIQAPYQPDELDPGSYSYTVTGYENDIVMGANVQYQSIDSEYVVGLISGDERYIVNLFLLKDEVKAGSTVFKAYDVQKSPVGPSAAIYINAFLYIAESGEINIENDPKTGELTGTYFFTARSKDFPDRVVTVAGSMNQVKLK